MKLIDLALALRELVRAKTRSVRGAFTGAVLMMLLTVSGSAVAANKITQAICDLKNYLFESVFIAALGAFAVTAALVWHLMEDDNKTKGKILAIFIVLTIIAALPELMNRFGYGAC